MLGKLSYHFQSYEEALTYYDKAIKLNSNDSEFYALKDQTFFILKDYNEAIRSYSKAIQIKQKPRFFLNGHITFNKLHKYHEAALDIESALKMDPEMNNAWRLQRTFKDI